MMILDNINHFLGADLKQTIRADARLKIVAITYDSTDFVPFGVSLAASPLSAFVGVSVMERMKAAKYIDRKSK